MPSRPVLLVVADPPREDDPAPVQQAKAVAAAEAWAGRLRDRGEDVTFAGLLPSRQRPGRKAAS